MMPSASIMANYGVNARISIDIIQCTNCLKWAHAACADRDDDGFICDFCD